MKRNLLLVSNSISHGRGYLDHCESHICNILQGKKTLLFIPYARPSGKTLEEYTEIARARFDKMGLRLYGIHEYGDDAELAVHDAEALFIGGGNTFVLLKSLYDHKLLESIRNKVHEGMPYIGTSAGANVAGKTIMTTNDMPIVYPPSFEAMAFVPFIINPHYVDPDPYSTNMGEPRETRIKEYHIFNNETVVGLRESAMLRVLGDTVTLEGSTGVRIFRKGQVPTECRLGESLDFLLNSNA